MRLQAIMLYNIFLSSCRGVKELYFSRIDLMWAEEGVEVGAVNIDYATDLQEGGEALVAVVLLRLGRDTE